MTRRIRSVAAGVAAAAMSLAMAQAGGSASATPVQHDRERATRMDNLPNPLGDKQAKLQREAVQKLVAGKATTEMRGGERVIKLKGTAAATGTEAAKDRYVRYPVEREEDIFTILSEFGTQTMDKTGGTPGPRHNQIPRPDRNWDGSATDDNSTFWKPDFNRAHYKDLMFGDHNSFRDFYTKQSNGRFLAKGDVSGWVQVPYNEARYGSNKISDAEGAWPFIADTATAWYESQKKAGKTDAEIAAYVKQFDKVDRYDADGDGVYKEPDGYIDHFQAIHAGEGEEAGGGAQGEDAIWSHRWYAYSNNIGRTGPTGNKLGGVPIGNTGIWIGDYTTEPENGGLGVFVHEFGHDLGLPDLYDTAGGDNGTGFWTLMSGGSWLNNGTNAIGTHPGYFGAWEKLQLGWLDYAGLRYGYDRDVKVGPADRDSATLPQALAVNLPDQKITTTYNKPFAGSYEWWGGSADGLNSTLSRPVDLTGASSASVSAMVWAETEQDYDAMYAEVSTDGGKTWEQTGDVIEGSQKSWTKHTWDLSAYAGKQITFRFRYSTDGGVHFAGPFLDQIALTVDGAVVDTEGAETTSSPWTADGFTRTTGSTTRMAQHFYLAENRVYHGYDKFLQTGPYNFGWANTRPNWVERFPYQNGLLIWYVNGAYEDNNTSVHPGYGQALPVDARPEPVKFRDGSLLGNRRQPFDATFGQEATDEVTFHRLGMAKTVPSRPAKPTFFDLDKNKYWTADNPWSSVKVAGTGTKITVAQTSNEAQDMLLQVRYNR